MIIHTLKLIFLILSLVLLFFTGFIGMQNYYPGAIQDILVPVNNFINSRVIYIVYPLLMMLFPLLYVIMMLGEKVRRGESYTIKGPEGNSSISENSIIKSHISAVRTVPTVKKVNPVIRNEKNGIAVDLHLQVQLTHFVPNICEQVRKRAASTLNNVLGVERVSRINVDIDDVKFPAPPLAEKMEDSKKSYKKEDKISLPEKDDKKAKTGISTSPEKKESVQKYSKPGRISISDEEKKPEPFKPKPSVKKEEETPRPSPFPEVTDKPASDKRTPPGLSPGPKSPDTSQKPRFPWNKKDKNDKDKEE